MDHTLSSKDLIHSHLLSELNFPPLSNTMVNEGDRASEFSQDCTSFSTETPESQETRTVGLDWGKILRGLKSNKNG